MLSKLRRLVFSSRRLWNLIDFIFKKIYLIFYIFHSLFRINIILVTLEKLVNEIRQAYTFLLKLRSFKTDKIKFVKIERRDEKFDEVAANFAKCRRECCLFFICLSEFSFPFSFHSLIIKWNPSFEIRSRDTFFKVLNNFMSEDLFQYVKYKMVYILHLITYNCRVTEPRYTLLYFQIDTIVPMFPRIRQNKGKIFHFKSN